MLSICVEIVWMFTFDLGDGMLLAAHLFDYGMSDAAVMLNRLGAGAGTRITDDFDQVPTSLLCKGIILYWIKHILCTYHWCHDISILFYGHKIPILICFKKSGRFWRQMPTIICDESYELARFSLERNMMYVIFTWIMFSQTVNGQHHWWVANLYICLPRSNSDSV